MLDLEEITARFQSIADYARSGKVNHRWLGSLPEQLATLAREWDLEIGAELGAEIGADFSSGVSSVVLACTGPLGDAVLKLAPDTYALAEEVAMLRQFAPSGRVPAVLATAKGAVLLEAIKPGVPVEQLPEAPSPTDYALFLNELHSAGDPESAPRKAADWLELMYGWTERGGLDVTESRRITAELFSAPAERVLLHGDLHLGNVLASDTRGLVARSPIACVGERCFDAADYVLEGWDRTEMVFRRDELARAADLDPDRLDAWCRALAPLGASRSNTPERIAELLAFGRGEY
ncbi:aminoglycoside phosphotransferase family protein [Micromonospora sp. NPDC048935]|uniref:aminoglycoside phosphotransferase family protein n=1 Tax=Micromonospora sp. NPDC048935 TaxID=3364262 RepID=UPI003719E3B5